MNSKNPFEVKKGKIGLPSPLQAIQIALSITLIVVCIQYLWGTQIKKEVTTAKQYIEQWFGSEKRIVRTKTHSVTCPQMKGYKVVKDEDGFSCNYTTIASAKRTHEESHIGPLDSNGCEIVNKSAKPDKNGGYRIQDAPGNVTIPTCVMPKEIVEKYDSVDICYVNDGGDAVTKVKDADKEFLVYCRGKKMGQPAGK